MRDPTVNAAEEKRVQDAIEAAREHLYWVLVWKRRWKYSRWSGQDPKDDWENSFRDWIEVQIKIINDPAYDSLLRKYYADGPNAREANIAMLKRARTLPRKKGVLREQTNALRNQYIAGAVALTCRDGTFPPTRNKNPKTKATRNRKESGCSIVAKALSQLKITMNENSVTNIWTKHKHLYRYLWPR
jgi:hypothetical protein